MMKRKLQETETVKAHSGMVIRFSHVFPNRAYTYAAIGIEIKGEIKFYITGASERPFSINSGGIPESPCTWKQIRMFADGPIELAASWAEVD